MFVVVFFFMSELIIGSFLDNDHNTGAHKLDKQKNGLVFFFIQVFTRVVCKFSRLTIKLHQI